jgi:hypothetical protein
MEVPEKPSLDGLERKWGEWWETAGIFRFDRSKTREEIFAIDTPPPPSAGSLHVGHVMSYTHTDLIARYQRMRGKEVFYPIGWDDNGLATERRVQNYFGVRCDPTLPYDPAFDIAALERPDGGRAGRVSRRNFIELCDGSPSRMRRRSRSCSGGPGWSVDWTHSYTTIGEPVAPRLAAGVSCISSPRKSRTRRRLPRCGTSTSTRRSRRRRSRIASKRVSTIRIAFDREDGETVGGRDVAAGAASRPASRSSRTRGTRATPPSWARPS